jgi:hypothetical protein
MTIIYLSIVSRALAASAVVCFSANWIDCRRPNYVSIFISIIINQHGRYGRLSPSDRLTNSPAGSFEFTQEHFTFCACNLSLSLSLFVSVANSLPQNKSALNVRRIPAATCICHRADIREEKRCETRTCKENPLHK